MRIVKFLSFFILVFNLISCATIINGSTEKVKIVTNADDSQIYINEVFVGSAGPETPLEVTIPKRGRIEFVGKKESCDDGEAVVRRSIDPATFLGLLIDGGFISILFVDILGTNAFVRASEQIYYLELDCRT